MIKPEIALPSEPPPQKPMTCWQCPRYTRTERRCLDGKTNPKSKVASDEVAKTLGVNALCHYNLHRDAIAFRTYFPNSPITRAMTAESTRKKRRKREGDKVIK